MISYAGQIDGRHLLEFRKGPFLQLADADSAYTCPICRTFIFGTFQFHHIPPVFQSKIDRRLFDVSEFAEPPSTYSISPVYHSELLETGGEHLQLIFDRMHFKAYGQSYFSRCEKTIGFMQAVPDPVQECIRILEQVKSWFGLKDELWNRAKSRLEEDPELAQVRLDDILQKCSVVPDLTGHRPAVILLARAKWSSWDLTRQIEAIDHSPRKTKEEV